MAAFGTTKNAPTKWAQRTDTLYVTLAIADVKDETLNVTEKSVSFKGKSGGKWCCCGDSMIWMTMTDGLTHTDAFCAFFSHCFLDISPRRPR